MKEVEKNHMRYHYIWRFKILYFNHSKDLLIWWLIWLQFKFLGHLQITTLSLWFMQPKVTISLFWLFEPNINLALQWTYERDSQFNPNYSFSSFNNYLEFLWALAAKETTIYKKKDDTLVLIKYWQCAMSCTMPWGYNDQ